MKEIGYQRPTSLTDACAALAQPDARVLAGGTDLIVQLREGRRTAGTLVDLKYVRELTGVAETDDGGLGIGAAAAARQLAGDQRISDGYPALATALGMIGSTQIQNRATLGGNICNAAPSADAVPPLMAYGARCRIIGESGERTMAIEEIFAAPGKTNLKAGELLVAIELPPPAPRSGAHYVRFTPRREMDIAVVGVAAWLALGDDGRIADARVALAAVAPTPTRAAGAEAALQGQMPNETTFEAAANAAAAGATPISDTRGSAEFRKALLRTLTKRALLDANPSSQTETR